MRDGCESTITAQDHGAEIWMETAGNVHAQMSNSLPFFKF